VGSAPSQELDCAELGSTAGALAAVSEILSVLDCAAIAGSFGEVEVLVHLRDNSTSQVFLFLTAVASTGLEAEGLAISKSSVAPECLSWITVARIGHMDQSYSVGVGAAAAHWNTRCCFGMTAFLQEAAWEPSSGLEHARRAGSPVAALALLTASDDAVTDCCSPRLLLDRVDMLPS
jgi:hypothetical protein